MKQLILLLTLSTLFTSCAQYKAAMAKKSKAKSAINDTNSSKTSPSDEVAHEETGDKINLPLTDYEKPNRIQNRQNMVHIIRKANGTTIEFWVDLYNDDIKIDYEFDNSKGFTETVEILPISVPTSDTQIDLLELYLASYEKAQLLTHQKKYSSALKSINQALSLSPKTVQGWKLKGSILYKLHNKVAARKAWKKALKLDPYAKDVQASLRSLDKDK